MGWTTHDRETDHHGDELDTHVILDGATYSYTDSYNLHAAIADMDNRIADLNDQLSLGMVPQYSSAPHAGTEIEGESYYNTTDHKGYTWNGTGWQAWWT